MDAERTDDPRPEWTAIASYGAQYETEIPVRQLEGAGIPVLVKGGEAGIWGPGFPGPTSQGLTLMVPADRAEEARELLELD